MIRTNMRTANLSGACCAEPIFSRPTWFDADLSRADLGFLALAAAKAVQYEPDRHQVRGRHHAGQQRSSVSGDLPLARSPDGA